MVLLCCHLIDQAAHKGATAGTEKVRKPRRRSGFVEGLVECCASHCFQQQQVEVLDVPAAAGSGVAGHQMDGPEKH